MQIIAITIVRQHYGMDQIVFRTDIPDSVTAGEMFSVLGYLPRGAGPAFAAERFAGIPVELIDVAAMQAKKQ